MSFLRCNDLVASIGRIAGCHASAVFDREVDLMILHGTREILVPADGSLVIVNGPSKWDLITMWGNREPLRFTTNLASRMRVGGKFLPITFELLIEDIGHEDGSKMSFSIHKATFTTGSMVQAQPRTLMARTLPGGGSYLPNYNVLRGYYHAQSHRGTLSYRYTS